MSKIKFPNRIVILGYGSIGRAVLPLLFNHIEITPDRVLVFAKDMPSSTLLSDMGVAAEHGELTRDNYRTILDGLVDAGDVLLNLTAGVSSIDLMRYASNRNIVYLDTCIEFWPDESAAHGTTHDARQQLLNLKADLSGSLTTAVSSMGANPGVVSLLSKRLMLKMGRECGVVLDMSGLVPDWGGLAQALSVHTIHINERDTQYSRNTFGKQDFVSTWSVEAMIIECIDPAEMAIGSHEHQLPDGAVYCGDANRRDIYFDRPGKDVRISTWLPLAGEQKGMVLNHNEPLSLAELFSKSNSAVSYSPTVCFVYHPTEQTMASVGALTPENCEDFKARLILEDIEGGHDELGVFVMTRDHGAFWLGSRLDVHAARQLNPECSATSLQVAGGVVAGVCWAITNAERGVVEPEDINEYDYLLDIAEPYWGGFVYARSNWLPGSDTPDRTLQFDSFLK